MYHQVIKNYPNTPASADAAYRIGLYFETIRNDYLNAYRYYRFSTEQNSKGTHSNDALNKKNIFQKYFELQSIISDKKINTDYDTEFKKNTLKDFREEKRGEDNNKEPDEENIGKPGGSTMADSNMYNADSLYIKNEKSARAKFELAELFLYELKNNDSTEFYLQDAYNQSNDYDFKAKVLFTLAEFYRSTGNLNKSEELHREVIERYPLSEIHSASKRILNIQVEKSVVKDIADSLYNIAQLNFSNDNYLYALKDFVQIVKTYPQSAYVEKSLYAIGWIYENVIMNPDSAVYYYSLIINNFPKSEFTPLISEKINVYNSYLSGDTVNNNGSEENRIIQPQENMNEQGEDPESQIPANDGTLPEKDPYLREEEIKTGQPKKK
jgi:tetratricopeptide (TPR) repeat protein